MFHFSEALELTNTLSLSLCLNPSPATLLNYFRQALVNTQLVVFFVQSC